MSIFLTHYSFPNDPDHDTYTGVIKAVDAEEAEKLANARGIGETFHHFSPVKSVPSIIDFNMHKYISEERWAAAAHEASFISFVGLSAGVLSVEEVLGDLGLVHILIHLETILKVPKNNWEIDKKARLTKRVLEMYDDFITRIPGMQGD